MVTKPAPTLTDDLGTRLGIREPLTAVENLSYTLTYEDVNTINGSHPLEQVSLNVYGDSRFWFVIAEANPLKDPRSWGIGDVVLIPAESPMSMIRHAQV